MDTLNVATDDEQMLDMLNADNTPVPTPVTVQRWFDPRHIYWYFAKLNDAFGWRLMVFIVLSQMLLKGMVHTMSMKVMLPIFKDVLHLDAVAMQKYHLVAMLPWSMKPFMGLLSDKLPLCGYHKRPYLVAALLVGVAGSAVLFFATRALSISLCFAAVHVQVSFFDLMTEGVYSAQMRQHPQTGSGMVTYVQLCIHVGSLLAFLLVGLLSDAGTLMALFACVCSFCMVPMMPTLFGWLPETATAHNTPEQKAMVAVIAASGLCAPVLAVLSITVDPAIAFSVALVMTAMCVMYAFWVFPRVVACVALYQVVVRLSQPNLGGAMDYWYTADAQCLPNGPHFSYTYYIMFAGIVGTAASAAGAVMYQNWFSSMRYRSVLCITAVLGGIAGLSDLFVVTRANIALGIPDRWAYIIGQAIMEPVLGMLNYIPVSTLLSKVAPRGMESSVFAFLATMHNFSGMISSITGVLIYESTGIRTTGACNFASLPWLIIVCHVALPILAAVPATLLLIPKATQTEQLE